MTPRSRGIATLRALCGAADWARNGRVDRLQMERWLNGECRALTSQLPATAIFDLLQTHAYGTISVDGRHDCESCCVSFLIAQVYASLLQTVFLCIYTYCPDIAACNTAARVLQVVQDLL